VKRTLHDIRENLDYVGCDNETALELCAEIERLRGLLRRAGQRACGPGAVDIQAVMREALKEADDES